MSYYKFHLNFESRPNSREYLLDRCIKVLAMIAKTKDRILIIETEIRKRENTREFFFYPIGQYRELFESKQKVLSRLQQYYNYRLSLVTKF